MTHVEPMELLANLVAVYVPEHDELRPVFERELEENFDALDRLALCGMLGVAIVKLRIAEEQLARQLDLPVTEVHAMLFPDGSGSVV